MNYAFYLGLTALLLLGIAFEKTWLWVPSITLLAAFGAWTFIRGRKTLSPEEKEILKENGDVSGGN